ncbi:MAG: 4-hydroxy-tetrahydrodipicolinate reductase [Limnochordales bacterium]|jgi:dihydrodipicolinate reductase|nr:4-hydroxy-tetrahydrodipicolinate reductase [Bacillota bacterium]
MTLHRVLVAGYSGRMGRAVVEGLAEADDMVYVGGVRRGDDLRAAVRAAQPTVIVDFTVPEAVLEHVRIGLEEGVPLVVGTTGLTPVDLQWIDEQARRRELGVVVAANFALGAVLMMRFAREAARWFEHAEIIELHHEKKVDAPSGTAMRTAEAIGAARGETAASSDAGRLELVPGARGGEYCGVRIHSVRLPGHVAHQEVIFGRLGETLRIRHDLTDRRAFVPGVLLAIRRVGALRGVHGLEELLFPGA